jgi:sucrose-6-phosphate hydrolase SacC (GH32 family)
VRVRVRLLLDRSSLEVFGQDGESVLTELIFPGEGLDMQLAGTNRPSDCFGLVPARGSGAGG